MNADQVHLAGAIVAGFSAAVGLLQINTQRAVHWLWLLLLLAGVVAWAVTL